jgi:hypothetical protein
VELVDRLVLLDGAKEAAFDSMAREAMTALQQEEELVQAQAQDAGRMTQEQEQVALAEEMERQQRREEATLAQVGASAPPRVFARSVWLARVCCGAFSTRSL